MKRMIIAPHADDEVLGCGGLIAKYPEECAVVVCAGPTSRRLRELDGAKQALGYWELAMLNLPDGKLDVHSRELVTLLDQTIAAYRPDELYLPYPDLHQDHVAVYEAGMRAARGSMKENHFYVPNVFVYDSPAYTLELRPTGLQYSVFEEIEGEPLRRKVKAMEAYESENGGGASDMLERHAVGLGAQHRMGAVERYAAVRMIR